MKLILMLLLVVSCSKTAEEDYTECGICNVPTPETHRIEICSAFMNVQQRNILEEVNRKLDILIKEGAYGTTDT